ncbi:cytochrome b5 reductase 4, transcript variant X3 [Ictidomys tridecemlineatus]|uniref:cytochrome b5 reductase 4 isoform X4 n=1 Tax=Ictidomys tridecemlineatus TaxID=43179 RepID=UPI000B545C07|nr:cytochrome b5 reductase 4 isoform X4 [Ictidomys tridecemlineatus]KAG3289866.1 cytochrome b5 reductase 4, transcript variant X3 [Ictidomys tridecemlineatus]
MSDSGQSPGQGSRMLNVPSQSFPAPSSQQRVASGGRSKVPLKQGRSLMDWIRLSKSGKDLTGLKGRLIDVTEEELKKHNKKEDCWICIRGFVYNVSSYMEFHPGGEDELMRAAGSDGTDLFDQVHRWVNYESMLKECLVGRMAVKPAIPKDYREEKRVLNGLLPKSQMTDISTKGGPSSPSYDWFQTDSLVTLVIYTKQKDIHLDSIIIDHQNDSFRAETIIKDYSYLIHIGLSHEVQEDFSVRVVENVGKIEIVLKKTENISWKCLGRPLEKHNSLIPKKDTGLYYRKCQLISKEDVTHDTKLFCLMLPPSTHLQVPIGQHVYLKLTITGDFVPVSNPEGNFKISKLQEVEDLFLLAAGTGFTPMVKILKYALINIPSLRKVKLMFFNKTEDAIIWRSQLEKLAFEDKRFDVEYVLSAPTSEWKGKQGHISPALLSEFLNKSSEKSKVLLCICGPTPFTEQGIKLLHDLNFSKDEIHSFTA